VGDPASRLRLDQARWDRSLGPIVDELRENLGLADGWRVEAELHNLLIYGPGQFFLPHQDSEKADEMVGTLVVTLPSRFTGGAFVVEHGGEKITFRASKRGLTLVAFYADCRHEVRPVKEGYRIVLTYNLSIAADAAQGAGAAGARAADAEADLDLSRRLREHFGTPLPPRWDWQKDAPDRDPPNRLVYLLDHQYSQRGLAWHRLKGEDAARVATLRAAAEAADCEVVLALPEIQETWGCFDEDWDEHQRYGRSRRWTREDDEDWQIEEDGPPPPPEGPDRYALVELHDWSITLHHWLDASGASLEPVHTFVRDEEVCFATPTVELEPYASEYEGFMGNWGNTMDRWYRRAAVVVWPRERVFQVRAEASPAWALETLGKRIRSGALSEAQELARSLTPFWQAVTADDERRRRLFGRALRVAEALGDPELATALLDPFEVELLTPKQARAFGALAGATRSRGRTLSSAGGPPPIAGGAAMAPRIRWSGLRASRPSAKR
jgi:hypothetical protein